MSEDKNARWARQERERQKNPEYKIRSAKGKRDRHLQRHYGITLEEFEELERQQRGMCAICKQKPSGTFPLIVDHCHKTKEIRKLLCNTCNMRLGWLEKNLESCLNYLGIELVIE